MNKLLKMGLQKELLIESMSLIHLPGWELLEEKALVALKATVTVPFLNMVYGDVTLVAFQKIKKFYGEQSFVWLISEVQSDLQLLEWGFVGPDLTFEMGINLSAYHHPNTADGVEVREAKSETDLSKWMEVAAGWLKFTPPSVEEFFMPWIKTGKFIPFLGFCDGVPAATSLVYCGHLGAALYCLGTLPPFRNRGLGTAVTHACLQRAKQQKILQAVLYGSKMGKSMYEKIGFTVLQTLREYART